MGSATALGAASLHDGRHSVGNVATLAMELVAVMLALALGHRRGQKLPAAVVLIPVWVATGLLAPIALGLPLGIVAKRSSADPPHRRTMASTAGFTPSSTAGSSSRG